MAGEARPAAPSAQTRRPCTGRAVRPAGEQCVLARKLAAPDDQVAQEAGLGQTVDTAMGERRPQVGVPERFDGELEIGPNVVDAFESDPRFVGRRLLVGRDPGCRLFRFWGGGLQHAGGPEHAGARRVVLGHPAANRFVVDRLLFGDAEPLVALLALRVGPQPVPGDPVLLATTRASHHRNVGHASTLHLGPGPSQKGRRRVNSHPSARASVYRLTSKGVN